MTAPDQKPPDRRTLAATLHEQLAARRAFADQALALGHVLGRPILNSQGTRVGKIADIVVRWDTHSTYPHVTYVLAPVGRGFGVIDASEVVLGQTGVRLRSERQIVSRAVRREGDVALRRDVLDRQLVDVTGVQVVRAAEVYLLNRPNGWELAGIDVGVGAFARRLGPRRHRCPPPGRVIDWADLHAFVRRFSDTDSEWQSGPAVAAGLAGSGMQLDSSAAQLKKLSAKDVAKMLADLPRAQQAELTVLAQPAAAAQALAQLDEEHREALLSELDATSRARMQTLLGEDGR